MHRRATTIPRGFTIVETAVAIVIIATGVLGLVAAQQAWHDQSAWAERAAVATRLGNEIREMTFNVSRHDPVTGTATWGPESNEVGLEDYDDLDDFDGVDGTGLVLSGSHGTGPVNAMRQLIPGMTQWTQTIRVFNVDPGDVNSDVPDSASDMMRVEVVIDWQGPGEAEAVMMTRVGWLAPK